MTDQTASQVPPTSLIDYTGSSEIFIDGLGGLQVRNGVAKMNFYALRHARDGSDQAQGVATLVMTLPDLVSMTASLTQMVRQLQSQGVFGPVAQTQVQSEPSSGGEDHSRHEHHNG